MSAAADMRALIARLRDLSEAAVPGAEWFQASDLAKVNFIDNSAAKLVAALTPERVLALCAMAEKGASIESAVSRLQGEVLALPSDDSRANDEFSDRRSAYLSAHDNALNAAAALVRNAFVECD
ncbi:hypothetical protein [Geopseudomonas aromaticivorans]